MVINLTPHDVNIYRSSDCYLQDGDLYLREDTDPQPLLVYPATNEPARVTFVHEPSGMVDGILVYRWAPHEITGLPDSKPGTYYIVSKMLAQACPEREDLIFPSTLVYDADERIVGCIDFYRV